MFRVVCYNVLPTCAHCEEDIAFSLELTHSPPFHLRYIFYTWSLRLLAFNASTGALYLDRLHSPDANPVNTGKNSSSSSSHLINIREPWALLFRMEKLFQVLGQAFVVCMRVTITNSFKETPYHFFPEPPVCLFVIIINISLITTLPWFVCFFPPDPLAFLQNLGFFLVHVSHPIQKEKEKEKTHHESLIVP